MNTTKIAAALRVLADAIEDPGVDTAKVVRDAQINKADDEAREAMQKARDEAKANEPEDTVEEVTLEDLQELGASLLQAKKRDAFVEVLASFDLKNLSGASEDLYPQLWEALKKAAQ